ncbi:MAG: Wadjet anti-phage system protein JetD domain-containing protein, partial [Desulfobacula sp.]
LWGREPSPVSRDLPLLTTEEAFVYDALRKDLYAPSLRLEQERISFTQVRRVLGEIQKI